MMDDDSSKEKMDSLLDALVLWFSVLIAIVIAAVLLFAGGWLFQVPFGKKTTSEYIHLWTDIFQHPEETVLGKWVEETVKRIKT